MEPYNTNSSHTSKQPPVAIIRFLLAIMYLYLLIGTDIHIQLLANTTFSSKSNDKAGNITTRVSITFLCNCIILDY